MQWDSTQWQHGRYIFNNNGIFCKEKLISSKYFYIFILYNLKTKKMKNFTLLTLAGLFISLSLFANKTSVEVLVPESATAGETVTVTVNVTHRGNSRMHYTDWVSIQLNGEEVERWEYDRNTLPRNEDFTLIYTFQFEGETEILVEGNCNLHGSAGDVVKTIKVAQEE